MHKLRSFFMVTGTILGVTFLIAVVALIKGVDTYVREDVARRVVGLNVVTLRRRVDVQANASAHELRRVRHSRALRSTDAEWLREQMQVPGIVATSTGGRAAVRAVGGASSNDVSVIAASASYFDVQNLRPEEGRLFSTREVTVGARVVVIGANVAQKLMAGRAAVGRIVRIAGAPYQVIGVLEAQGTLFGASLDDVAILPATSPFSAAFGFPHAVSDIIIKVPEAALLAAARAEIVELMRVRHELGPREANDFVVHTSDASLMFLGKVTGIMLVALPALVSISLVVGAVVMMNIMLVSLAERTREIGLRKSLGARSRDILLQFLVETSVVSGLGGMIGVGAGMLLAALIAILSPLPAQVPVWAVGTALLLSWATGLAAGVYPAFRAARLDPIHALQRH